MMRGRKRAVAGNGGTLPRVTERSLVEAERELEVVRPGDVDGLEGFEGRVVGSDSDVDTRFEWLRAKLDCLSVGATGVSSGVS